MATYTSASWSQALNGAGFSTDGATLAVPLSVPTTLPTIAVGGAAVQPLQFFVQFTQSNGATLTLNSNTLFGLQSFSFGVSHSAIFNPGLTTPGNAYLGGLNLTLGKAGLAASFLRSLATGTTFREVDILGYSSAGALVSDDSFGLVATGSLGLTQDGSVSLGLQYGSVELQHYTGGVADPSGAWNGFTNSPQFSTTGTASTTPATAPTTLPGSGVASATVQSLSYYVRFSIAGLGFVTLNGSSLFGLKSFDPSAYTSLNLSPGHSGAGALQFNPVDLLVSNTAGNLQLFDTITGRKRFDEIDILGYGTSPQGSAQLITDISFGNAYAVNAAYDQSNATSFSFSYGSIELQHNTFSGGTLNADPTFAWSTTQHASVFSRDGMTTTTPYAAPATPTTNGLPNGAPALDYVVCFKDSHGTQLTINGATYFALDGFNFGVSSNAPAGSTLTPNALSLSFGSSGLTPALFKALASQSSFNEIDVLGYVQSGGPLLVQDSFGWTAGGAISIGDTGISYATNYGAIDLQQSYRQANGTVVYGGSEAYDFPYGVSSFATTGGGGTSTPITAPATKPTTGVGSADGSVDYYVRFYSSIGSFSHEGARLIHINAFDFSGESDATYHANQPTVSTTPIVFGAVTFTVGDSGLSPDLLASLSALDGSGEDTEIDIVGYNHTTQAIVSDDAFGNLQTPDFSVDGSGGLQFNVQYTAAALTHYSATNGTVDSTVSWNSAGNRAGFTKNGSTTSAPLTEPTTLSSSTIMNQTNDLGLAYYAHITLADGTTLALDGNALFALTDFNFDAARDANGIHLNPLTLSFNEANLDPALFQALSSGTQLEEIDIDGYRSNGSLAVEDSFGFVAGTSLMTDESGVATYQASYFSVETQHFESNPQVEQAAALSEEGSASFVRDDSGAATPFAAPTVRPTSGVDPGTARQVDYYVVFTQLDGSTLTLAGKQMFGLTKFSFGASTPVTLDFDSTGPTASTGPVSFSSLSFSFATAGLDPTLFQNVASATQFKEIDILGYGHQSGQLLTQDSFGQVANVALSVDSSGTAQGAALYGSLSLQVNPPANPSPENDVIENGATGANAASGSGAAGGNGGAVTATANLLSDSVNTAYANGTSLSGIPTPGAGTGGAGEGAGAGGAGGAAQASATSDATDVGNTTAQAVAYGGTGGASGTGVGGAGGAATASASDVSGATAIAIADAFGGTGGAATGGKGGAGGVASGVLATATGGTRATVEADEYGGAGGANMGAGTAGAGASSMLMNAVSGMTTGGNLFLGQVAIGGDGGAGAVTGGKAGSGSSSLTFDDTGNANRSAILVTSSEGDGGDGGNVVSSGDTSGATAIGGVAGTGTASNTTTGVAKVQAFANAIGGNGGGNLTTGAGSGNVGGLSGNGRAGGAATAATASARGGDALAQAYEVGGSGGAAAGTGYAGGAGGAVSGASAAAIGVTSANASIYAYGGNGGDGAATPNSATTTGQGGASGGVGAATTLSNAVTGGTSSGALKLTQFATGGTGGRSAGGTAGAGGAASSSLTFTDGSVSGNSASVTANVAATGGNGGAGSNGSNGAAGGSASAADSVTGPAVESATATATGGNGGDADGAGHSGGAGGSSSGVTASAVTSGPFNATASAVLTGGAGGNGTNGANGGAGAGVSVSNSVNNSFTQSGYLFLNQTVTGGVGGASAGGVAGSGGGATSSLTFDDTASVALSTTVTATVSATGGAGGAGTGVSGSAGGSGSSTITLTADGDASATANATGGTGGAGDGAGNHGSAGATAKATASAVSTDSGNATANLSLTGGAGGAATNGAAGGAGAAVSRSNGVTGRTTGASLTLNQAVTGGAGGGSAGGTATAGASGSSTLTFDDTTSSTRSASLIGTASGTGGAGGAGTGVSGAGGGTGTSSITLTAAQDVTATANATGGAGGAGDGAGNHGGAGSTGRATARATTTGAATDTVNVTQTGGAGGAGTNSATGGAGAVSSLSNAVRGITSGGGLILSQSAVGGAGGASTDGTAAGGAGGAATSTFTLNDTTSAVLSGTVSATGGAGGAGSLGGAGGNATATETLTGTSLVIASTSATGGTGGSTTNPGVASAKTTATGVSGSAMATAESDPGIGALVTTLKATATGVLDGSSSKSSTAIAQASAQSNAALTFTTSAQSVAITVTQPRASDVSAVLSSHPNINSAFTSSADQMAMALGELGGKYDTNGVGTETITSSIEMMIDPTKLSSPGSLFVGFYHPIKSGASFTNLALSVSVNGVQTLNKTYTNATAAAQALTDAAFNVASLGTSPTDLLVTMTETTKSANSGFFADVIVFDPPTSGPPAPYIYAAHSGADTIAAFHVAGDLHDTLNLPSSEFGTFDDLLSHTSMSGTDAVIHGVGDDSITLKNVSVADMANHSGDFVLRA